MARLILEYKLSGTEVRGAVQICLRRGVTPDVGVSETVKIRPVIERRYVQLGRITDPQVSRQLSRMPVDERQTVMASAVALIGLDVIDARLQPGGYTLVLEESVARSVEPDATEGRLNEVLAGLMPGRTWRAKGE
jgi:hypothetical protein